VADSFSSAEAAVADSSSSAEAVVADSFSSELAEAADSFSSAEAVADAFSSELAVADAFSSELAVPLAVASAEAVAVASEVVLELDTGAGPHHLPGRTRGSCTAPHSGRDTRCTRVRRKHPRLKWTQPGYRNRSRGGRWSAAGM